MNTPENNQMSFHPFPRSPTEQLQELANAFGRPPTEQLRELALRDAYDLRILRRITRYYPFLPDPKQQLRLLTLDIRDLYSNQTYRAAFLKTWKALQ